MGVVAMVGLLWRINGSQHTADARLANIEHDVNQIWIQHDTARGKHEKLAREVAAISATH